MFNAITHSSVFVLDQDEALDYYVGKLGFEVADDVDMGFMRWLTIRLPSEPDRQVLLERRAVLIPLIHPLIDERLVVAVGIDEGFGHGLQPDFVG